MMFILNMFCCYTLMWYLQVYIKHVLLLHPNATAAMRKNAMTTRNKNTKNVL